MIGNHVFFNCRKDSYWNCFSYIFLVLTKETVRCLERFNEGRHMKQFEHIISSLLYSAAFRDIKKSCTLNKTLCNHVKRSLEHWCVNFIRPKFLKCTIMYIALCAKQSIWLGTMCTYAGVIKPSFSFHRITLILLYKISFQFFLFRKFLFDWKPPILTMSYLSILT